MYRAGEKSAMQMLKAFARLYGPVMHRSSATSHRDIGGLWGIIFNKTFYIMLYVLCELASNRRRI